MTNKEYIELFHRAQVNLVAFKPVFHCDDELRRMVEVAIEDEREACAKLCEEEAKEAYHQEASYLPQGNPGLLRIAEGAKRCAHAIRARGEK
jgi:hypothetical protein